jgi:hypothetical protein
VALLTTILPTFLLPSYLKSLIRSHFQTVNQTELSEILSKIAWVKTKNAWANTLASEDYSHYLATKLDPGIGVVWIANPKNLVMMTKPRYLLIKKENVILGVPENYDLVSESRIWSLFVKKPQGCQ